MNRIFKDAGKQFWEILRRLNLYCVSNEFPSLKKTIERFEFDSVYTDVLDYIEFIDEDLNSLKDYLSTYVYPNHDFAIRIKAENFLSYKWEKNLGRNKQFREVCNDIIGIRIVSSLKQEHLQEVIKELMHDIDYKTDIVNFYKNPKSVDDGYRGIHIYFRDNPKCYPIEIQFWTRKDWLLNV